MSVLTFTVEGRAQPSLNGRRERIPRVMAWYQTVRFAMYDAFKQLRVMDCTGKKARLGPPLVIPDGHYGVLRATFHLKGGGKNQPDLAQLEKALEDAIFADDFMVTEHYCGVDRMAGRDWVEVVAEIVKRQT